MKILLTGASGFVGNHLASKLRDKRNEIYEIHRATSKNAIIFTDKSKVVGNLLDFSRIEEIVKALQPEMIIHLAALTPVRLSWLQPFLYELTNFNGTYNLLESAMKHLSKFKFVYSSTAEVYGEHPPDKYLRENDELHPISPYAETKVKAERYVINRLWNSDKVEYLILRPSNTYGRPHSGYFVETMMEQILQTVKQVEKIKEKYPNTVVMYETPQIQLYYPKNKRDYMFIEDHVGAYLHLLKEGETGIFNIAQGSPISNIDMVRLMAKVLDVEIEIVEKEPDFPRPKDQENIWQDLTKIHRTGWYPKYSREEGVRKLREMYG